MKTTPQSSSDKGTASPSKTATGGNNHVGSIKKKKVEQKAREKLQQTLRGLSDKVGKLEDRDTQQQAFQSLVYEPC